MRKTQTIRERPGYIGIYQAAKYCNTNYRVIKAAMEAGTIPYVKLGPQTYRISVDELDRIFRLKQKRRFNHYDRKERNNYRFR